MLSVPMEYASLNTVNRTVYKLAPLPTFLFSPSPGMAWTHELIDHVR